MLVLTRRLKEKIRIGNEVTIQVIRINNSSVQLAIEAPKDVNIIRHEIIREDKVIMKMGSQQKRRR